MGLPWQLGLIGLLFAAAFYLPTTVVDLPAGRGAVGDTTFAVRYGSSDDPPHREWRSGPPRWSSPRVCLARLNVVVPRTTLAFELALAPCLLGAYALLTRRPSVAQLAGLSFVFLIPTVGFALAIIRS